MFFADFHQGFTACLQKSLLITQLNILLKNMNNLFPKKLLKRT